MKNKKGYFFTILFLFWGVNFFPTFCDLVNGCSNTYCSLFISQEITYWQFYRFWSAIYSSKHQKEQTFPAIKKKKNIGTYSKFRTKIRGVRFYGWFYGAYLSILFINFQKMVYFTWKCGEKCHLYFFFIIFADGQLPTYFIYHTNILFIHIS